MSVAKFFSKNSHSPNPFTGMGVALTGLSLAGLSLAATMAWDAHKYGPNTDSTFIKSFLSASRAFENNKKTKKVSVDILERRRFLLQKEFVDGKPVGEIVIKKIFGGLCEATVGIKENAPQSLGWYSRKEIGSLTTTRGPGGDADIFYTEKNRRVGVATFNPKTLILEMRQ